MKKITIICLVVGVMIGCTDNNSVDKKEPALASQDVSSVLYKGEFYKADDERLKSLITPSSITLEFDFEDHLRLFDSREDVQEFAAKNYQGKYAKAIGKLLEPRNPDSSPKDLKSPLGSKNRPAKITDGGASRTQNTIYDFELAIVDVNCTTYPAQAWYINLPAYPTGTIYNIIQTVGYPAGSFSFDVPSGGVILLSYEGINRITQSCQSGGYVATASGCHQPSFWLCSPSSWHVPANRLEWVVDIGS
jgi:hypothetical protein